MPKKILVTEDDTILKDILANKLTKAGFEVKVAENGEKALEILKSETIDLLLLDILLPKKDGMAVLEEMGKNPKLSKIPVIAISNLGDPAEIEKAKRLGAKDFLVKAIFDSSQVLARINKLLNLPNQPMPDHLSKQSLIARPEPVQPVSAAPAAAPAVSPAPAVSLEGKTILIVEDDKFLRELAGQKLQKEGFNVYGTATAPEALTLLEKTKADVIALDLILPGMDGFEFLTKTQADPKLAAIPVIVLSNLGQADDIEKAKALGVKDYLVKAHFSFGEIIKKIRGVLGMPA